MSDVVESDDVEITDEELTALALAADPDEPLGADAVPFTGHLHQFPELLPSWYMPVPAGFTRSRRRAAVVALIVIALVTINAFGLCITSGRLEIPF